MFSSPPARPGRSRLRTSDRALRRSLSIAAAMVLAASGLSFGAAPVAAADPALPPAPMPAVTFHGRGYGHGVGMSQYGARGRALAGQLAPAILAHYYAGTTLGQRNPATIVRVLVQTGFAATAARPATITGRVGTWTIDGVAGTFPVDAKMTLAPIAVGSTTWALRVKSATGAALASATVKTAVIVRPATGTSYLELTSKVTKYNLYRGYLRVRLTTTVAVIDHVALDLYLRGVVPLEMPSTWPVQALRAQAIASRSYALYKIHPATGLYDLYDDTRSQTYRGKRAEKTATNVAIGDTRGTVLLNGTALVNALFHSADGGWTENNENVFVGPGGAIVAGPVSYLRGSSDRAPDGTSYDAASPYATWHTATYTAAALGTILAKDPRTNVGTLLGLDLGRRGVSGRLISVTISGSLGSKTVSGNVFQAVFNAGRPAIDPPLRGTLFDIAPIP